ncbi:MAG: hypothetical protein HWN65_04965 [Candidatus Helarchaeota archaeon]|nr:hypothetical protein [Candidatus Helarchaeota archaeon]
MPQDISKDPRVLMVEHALKQLRDLTVNKKYKLPASKEKTLEAINRLNSSIKTIKFSYISPVELVGDRTVTEFNLMADQFWDAILKNQKEIEKNSFIAATLRFIFNILKGFRDRLILGNVASIDMAIDIIAVRVISVTKGGNLNACRVGDGKKVLNIITNLMDVKKDLVLPAAILPPREFGSEISEAMFCSGQDLPDMHERVGERILNLPEAELKEVNNHIMNLLKDI